MAFLAEVHPSPCHRVDGWGLNLSRALGDFHYKAREPSFPSHGSLHNQSDPDRFWLRRATYRLNRMNRLVF